MTFDSVRDIFCFLLFSTTGNFLNKKLFSSYYVKIEFLDRR